MSELQLKSVLAFWKLYFLRTNACRNGAGGDSLRNRFSRFFVGWKYSRRQLIFQNIMSRISKWWKQPFLNLKVPNGGKSFLFIFPCLNSNTFKRQIVHIGLFRFPNSRLFRDWKNVEMPMWYCSHLGSGPLKYCKKWNEIHVVLRANIFEVFFSNESFGCSGS